MPCKHCDGLSHQHRLAYICLIHNVAVGAANMPKAGFCIDLRPRCSGRPPEFRNPYLTPRPRPPTKENTENETQPLIWTGRHQSHRSQSSHNQWQMHDCCQGGLGLSARLSLLKGNWKGSLWKKYNENTQFWNAAITIYVKPDQIWWKWLQLSASTLYMLVANKLCSC